MKRVFFGSTLADTTHVKNLVEHEGIDCFIKNVYLGAGVGELPVFDSTPELWVYRDEDAPAAKAVIERALAAPLPTAAASGWRCKSCGETNESQFAACWRCGERDSVR